MAAEFAIRFREVVEDHLEAPRIVKGVAPGFGCGGLFWPDPAGAHGGPAPTAALDEPAPPLEPIGRA